MVLLGTHDMGKTIVHGNFEWDADKEKANIKNHGISFEEFCRYLTTRFFGNSTIQYIRVPKKQDI